MSWTTDGRQPGVYLLSDEEPIRVFQQASGLVYEAASGIVVIQMAVYEPDEGGKSRLKFRPTAWLKLEEGMMLGLGYALSASGPLILGAVRDLSGGFDAVLWVLVAAGAVLVVLDSSFSPARLAAGRSSGEPPLRAASS